MKLRNLNGAIRKHTGAVKLGWDSPIGALVVDLQKTSLLEVLKDACDGDPQRETGLYLREDGCLMRDKGVEAPVAAIGNVTSSLSDPLAATADGSADGFVFSHDITAPDFTPAPDLSLVDVEPSTPPADDFLDLLG